MGRGQPRLISDLAIQTYLALKTLFRLPYRVTKGLLKSLMRWCQLVFLCRIVPSYGVFDGEIPRRPRRGAVHVVVDSTGLKLFGEGEGKDRQRGVGKRRTGRKIHLAMDETVKDIIVF